MLNPKFGCYNDGMVSIYREKENRSNFGARINPTALDDMDFIVKLAFAEMSKRQQDIEFAQQQGFSLEMKVKTRYVKDVDNKCKAVIDGCMYDISHLDVTRTEAFMYLQEVGKLAGND